MTNSFVLMVETSYIYIYIYIHIETYKGINSQTGQIRILRDFQLPIQANEELVCIH